MTKNKNVINHEQSGMTTRSGLSLSPLHLIYTVFAQILILKGAFWWKPPAKITKTSNFEHRSKLISINTRFIPKLFIITPTYERVTQFPDLINVVQSIAVSHIPTQLIIVEDTHFEFCSKTVQRIKNLYNYPNSLINFTLLTQESPLNKHELRGWKQRNTALNWAVDYVKNFKSRTNKMVVYFADDDNTFNSDIFKEFTKIGKIDKKHTVGMLPIGGIKNDEWNNSGIHGNTFQCRENIVVQIHNKFEANRHFPVDMANFAFKMDKLISAGSSARFNSAKDGKIERNGVRKGWLETCFLSGLFGIDCYQLFKNRRMHDIRQVYIRGWKHLPSEIKDQVVALADDCTRILGFHRKSEKPVMSNQSALVNK